MIREINIFLYGNYFIKEIDRMFKKMLIAVIANSREDLCAVVDVARDYAKSYRIGVYNDKKASGNDKRYYSFHKYPP